VRLAPRRRGTVVLRDGEYLTAVMTSQEGVLSYQARFAAATTLLDSAYVIRTEGKEGERALFEAVESTGEFRLLRVPAGDERMRADPETGVVTRE
jgi:uncharacterized NAD(P)/FAD-binding protein YdhS